VDVVEQALGRKDEKVAMQLLRQLGALRPARKRMTDSKLLQMQMTHQQSRRMQRFSRCCTIGAPVSRTRTSTSGASIAKGGKYRQ